MSCFRCGTVHNKTKDHIIPKRYNTTLNNNTMILCRFCHTWKEKNTIEILNKAQTKVIGIYNPVLKKKMYFRNYMHLFTNGIVRSKKKEELQLFEKEKKPPTIKRKGKLPIIKTKKKKPISEREIYAYLVINKTIKYEGQLKRAKRLLAI